MTATLLIVRHGEAAGNAEHRLNGWLDVPLTEKGRDEARRLAERLRGAGIERIVTSDLARAHETAMAASSLLGIEPEVDASIREIDNGAWTGMRPDEIAAAHPELWQAYLAGEDVHRPDGERWADVRDRAIPTIERLLADGGTTAVFTHGGPVVLSAAWALGIDLPGNIFQGSIRSVSNTSVTTLIGGPRVVGYNDIGHLDASAAMDNPYDPVREVHT